MASDNNVTPEQAREALDNYSTAMRKIGHDDARGVPFPASGRARDARDAVLRYIAQSAARIAELQSLTAWRPIETAPRSGERLIVRTTHSTCQVRIGWLDLQDDTWRDDNDNYITATHWLPLPAAPEVSL